MAERASLVPVFEGAYGVFNLQNPILSGVEGKIRHGKNVANVEDLGAIVAKAFAEDALSVRQ